MCLEQWNRINQSQSFLRVIPVRAGDADGEGFALPVADQITLAPALVSVVGVGPCLFPPRHSAGEATIHDRSRPINPVFSSEPIQQRGTDAARIARETLALCATVKEAVQEALGWSGAWDTISERDIVRGYFLDSLGDD